MVDPTEAAKLAAFDTGIRIARELVDKTPEGHPEWEARLDDLKCQLRSRFSITEATVDLEQLIKVVRRLVDTTRESEHRADNLDELAADLDMMYDRDLATDHLNESIELTREAVDATPEDDALQKGRYLWKLGWRSYYRYQILGAKDDIEEACHFIEKSIDVTPQDSPQLEKRSEDLPVLLRERYAATGAIVDLDRAIQVAQAMVESASTEHLSRAHRLGSLGTCFRYRYTTTGAFADLEEAIRLQREAIGASPKEKSDERAKNLASMGVLFADRDSRTKAMSDLEEAIRLTQEAIRLIQDLANAFPAFCPNFASMFNTIGTLLGDRYSRTGVVNDLEEAILYLRKAIDAQLPTILGQEASSNKAMFLSNLGVRLHQKYERTDMKSHLEEAIRVTQEAVDLTPENHSDRGLRLSNLGDLLEDWDILTEELVDVRKTLSCYRSALDHSNSPTIVRIMAAKGLFRSGVIIPDWQQAFEGSAIAVDLIARLTPRSLNNSDKQHMLSQVAGLACDAASAALNVGKVPSLILNLLEQGRGVLAASLEQMRPDLLDLEAQHPELADKFVRLRDELEPPITQNALSRIEPPSQSCASRRYTAGRELDKVINEVRKQPGFENFLLPPDEIQMQAAAACGPRGVINVSPQRCDALIVEQHRMRCLALPYLNSRDIEEKAQKGNLGSLEILGWLWDAIASPVLHTVGFAHRSSDGNWPHIWWIPTGALTKFPLHAAGWHANGSTETVLDKVMSSYSSSIRAILHSRSRRVPRATSSTHPQALLVAMQNTPKQASLPSAGHEIATVRHLCKSMSLHPVEPGRRKQDLLSHLPGCKILHFAGHGYTDDADPAQSSLLLEDWEADRLTVANLLEMNIREQSPFLAYLSACGTSQNHNENLVDENIHLVSACQLAGFRHVIGTLWRVEDDVCQEIARLTYEGIRDGITDGRLTDESVCQSLHKASRKLRNRWLSKSEGAKMADGTVPDAQATRARDAKSVRGRDQGDARMPWKIKSTRDDGMDWVPYVHFGL